MIPWLLGTGCLPPKLWELTKAPPLLPVIQPWSTTCHSPVRSSVATTTNPPDFFTRPSPAWSGGGGFNVHSEGKQPQISLSKFPQQPKPKQTHTFPLACCYKSHKSSLSPPLPIPQEQQLPEACVWATETLFNLPLPIEVACKVSQLPEVLLGLCKVPLVLQLPPGSPATSLCPYSFNVLSLDCKQFLYYNKHKAYSGSQ